MLLRTMRGRGLPERRSTQQYCQRQQDGHYTFTEAHEDQNCLAVEGTAHERSVVVGQHSNDLVVEVVGGRGRGAAITLVVGRLALFNVFLQTIIQVAVLAAVVHLALIV